ncbi:HET and Ankyrin domain-containing protein [Colletotrichum higginsianum]|uniref:HET and Ankyrin domain-containing protein n=1 Tax=Colletotrichum higginsianum (strain IMI 349063) TaxID=759273 RepID=H1VF04_COLHI|nr:HET and Ankyrin domain-containing protein [Colletotrichum higginsianum IMI 349063]OBR15206.1 HET and Ankyrin domain-containing protein [Colletotrichum higginsianum IMI 349063]CCF38807.1 HET and Ankyrin domain-containing protein [Colletotrichum higginsianum]
MRLLSVKSLEVKEFSANVIPPYAILSHRWLGDDEEVILQDIELPVAKTKLGYEKLVKSCKQAEKDGVEYVWIDSCCIDKTSSAELSESINSMFRWYKEAVVCYAFLSDVPSDSTLEDDSPFAKSKWFTRGWTLQELIAPEHLRFYSQEWKPLGSKSHLSGVISRITGIDELTLRGRRELHLSSIAARMSWAAKRETTREEDRSYSLLGLFGVHLPLLYGEGGKNAFLRLQEELIRISDDRSIFAWHSGSFRPQEELLLALSKGSSFLASSPADFISCSDIVICNLVRKPSNFVITNAGLRIDVPIIFEYEGSPPERRAHAILWCRRKTDYEKIITIPVLLDGNRCARAQRSMKLVNRRWAISRSFNHTLYMDTGKNNRSTVEAFPQFDLGASVLVLHSLPLGYCIDTVSPSENWEGWSPTSGRLTSTGLGETVIGIRADGSTRVPLENLYMLVKPTYETGLYVRQPRHRLALIDHNTDIQRNACQPPFLSYFETSALLPEDSILESTGGNFAARVSVDGDFAPQIDVVDLIIDHSTFRNFKIWRSLRYHKNLNAERLLRLLPFLAAALLTFLPMALRLKPPHLWVKRSQCREAEDEDGIHRDMSHVFVFIFLFIFLAFLKATSGQLGIFSFWDTSPSGQFGSRIWGHRAVRKAYEWSKASMPILRALILLLPAPAVAAPAGQLAGSWFNWLFSWLLTGLLLWASSPRWLMAVIHARAFFLFRILFLLQCIGARLRGIVKRDRMIDPTL